MNADIDLIGTVIADYSLGWQEERLFPARNVKRASTQGLQGQFASYPLLHKFRGSEEIMKQTLLEYLKLCTKQNPLNRYEAAEKLNTTERTIRELISSLRMDGVRVCADSSGKGYWIAEGEQDYKRFRAEYISRASSIFSTVFAMDGATDGQIGGLT